VLGARVPSIAVEKLIAFSSPFHAEIGYAVLALRRLQKWTHKKH
jgi:hypothetical protein